MINLHHINQRYETALNTHPAKGTPTRKAYLALADSVADVRVLMAEIERLRARLDAAEPHLRKKWAEELERAMFKVESVHHFGFGYHGFKCLCGFESLRNRSRTEHITQAVRNLLEGAGE